MIYYILEYGYGIYFLRRILSLVYVGLTVGKHLINKLREPMDVDVSIWRKGVFLKALI